MEEVKEDQYIKDILVKIQAIDSEAFDRFASEHSAPACKTNSGILLKSVIIPSQ